MCGPLLTIVGGVVRGIGAASQARNEARAAENDALMHDRQANIDRERGSFEAARLTERGKQLIGRQVASFGGNGFGISGSAADVIAQTGEAAGLDVANARYGTSIDVENENILSRASRQNAQTARRSIPLAFAAPIISSGATFLRGAFSRA